MAFDGETDEEAEDPTAAARAEIFAALDGSTMSEAEDEDADGEPADEAKDDADQ